jgi:hypothetical protein
MNTQSIRLFLLPCLVWLVPVVSGQTSTTVNLGTQARNPDFSAMPVTKPVTVGTSLPSTCVVGQLFFNSSASAGNNLSSCTATNTWSPVGNTLATPLSVANGGNGTSTPSLVAGTNVTITGSWPNQTISSTATGGTTGNATAIQGTTVANTPPVNNQTLVYNTSASSYIPTTIFTLQNGLGTAPAGINNLQVNISMGVRSVTTTSDNLVNTDCGGLVTYNNSSAVSVALAQPSLAGNFLSGCPITIRNYGAGTVTLTPASSTIGGASSQTVSQNKACLVVSDGSNWQLGNCN